MIAALEAMVKEKGHSKEYRILMEGGHANLTAEFVVMNNKQHFSEEVVDTASEKLDGFRIE